MAHQIPTGSPQLLRRINSAAVLRVIRADGPISRAELARSTGLSKPTINGAVELLLESGYLKERVADVDGRTRRPGPRSRLLSFRGDLGHLLGIDIGADKVLVVVADLTGDVLGTVRRRTKAGDRQTAETLLDLVRAATDEALATAGVDRSSLQSVGVGTPGVVDPGVGPRHAGAPAARVGGNPAREPAGAVVPLPRARRQRSAPLGSRRAVAWLRARDRRRPLCPGRCRHRRRHPDRRRRLPGRRRRSRRDRLSPDLRR